VPRAEKDYTKEVDKLLPEVEQIAKASAVAEAPSSLLTSHQSNPQAAIDKLLLLEKQTRQVERRHRVLTHSR
jgi:26S proteasome regulatory subunit N5